MAWGFPGESLGAATPLSTLYALVLSASSGGGRRAVTAQVRGTFILQVLLRVISKPHNPTERRQETAAGWLLPRKTLQDLHEDTGARRTAVMSSLHLAPVAMRLPRCLQ